MEVRSNWVVDSVVELHNAIQESTTFPSESVAELLDEEKCFSLTRPDEAEADEWCYIKLVGGQTASSWPPRTDAPAFSIKLIKGILLHSEARVVEVCVGPHDEYQKTVHGNRLGQYEDTEMCACEVQFDPPRREVLLTLKNTYNPECVWVFGMHIITTQELDKCSGGRFSSGRLSSVLKDKEVSMSKDAARFLHMLESYNTMHHGSSQLNENNQLALMSVFLEPKMINKGSVNTGILDKLDIKGGKDDTLNESKVNTVESSIQGSEAEKCHCVMSKYLGVGNTASEIENRMRKLEITDEENNKTTLKEELTNKGSNNNSAALCKESVTSRTHTIPSGNQDSLVKKLFTLMENSRHSLMEQQNTPRQCSVTKAEVTPPPTSALDHFPRPLSALSHDHSLVGHGMIQTLMESLNRIPSPNCNFRSPFSSVAGPVHSTPRSRELVNKNVLPADGYDAELSLEERGVLLREIENLIDRKFAEMEERLERKLEQKVFEKVQSDRERLEKIEEHLSKLCEHLCR